MLNRMRTIPVKGMEGFSPAESVISLNLSCSQFFFLTSCHQRRTKRFLLNAVIFEDKSHQRPEGRASHSLSALEHFFKQNIQILLKENVKLWQSTRKIEEPRAEDLYNGRNANGIHSCRLTYQIRPAEI